MKRVVVDTNVPILANGRPDPSNGGRQPSPHCRRAAIDFLVDTLKRRRILLNGARGAMSARPRRSVGSRERDKPKGHQ